MAGKNYVEEIVKFLQTSGKFQRAEDSGNFTDMARKSGMVIENWIATDTTDGTEIALLQQGDIIDETVRFQLTMPLTPAAISKHATDILTMAAGVTGSVGLVGDRLVLTYKNLFTSAEASRALPSLHTALRDGSQMAKRLRDVLAHNMQCDTDVSKDNLLKFKRGQPVKLSQRDMALAQGGISSSGMSAVAFVAALYPSAVTQVAGVVIDGAEAVDYARQQLVDWINSWAPTSTPANPGWSFGMGGVPL